MNNEHSTDTKMNTLPWMDKSLSPHERAEKLVAAMTLEQKIAQLHGAMETINIYTLPSADEINAMNAEEQEAVHGSDSSAAPCKGYRGVGIPAFGLPTAQ